MFEDRLKRIHLHRCIELFMLILTILYVWKKKQVFHGSILCILTVICCVWNQFFMPMSIIFSLHLKMKNHVLHAALLCLIWHLFVVVVIAHVCLYKKIDEKIIIQTVSVCTDLLAMTDFSHPTLRCNWYVPLVIKWRNV